MCKVIKDYGAVAIHGSKELKLQSIYGDNKEKRLALVSYKDGMSVNTTDITEEAKELKRLLEDYLGYKTPVKEEIKVDGIIKTLITLPAGDCNYQTALKEATEDDLKKAIEIMKNSDGKHQTRIKTCESQLSKMGKVVSITNTTTTPTTSTSNKKEYKYASEDKKPTIIPLKTDGNATYEECVAKLDEDAKTFIDGNCAYVINGLKELCKVDQDFRNNLMREDKTFGGFVDYMCSAAKNGYVISYGYCSWLDTDLSLGLAIDYYNADIKKMEEEEKKKREEEAAKRKAEADKKKKEAKTNGKKKSTKKK